MLLNVPTLASSFCRSTLNDTDVSEIRTGIIGVEGEHTDHKSNTKYQLATLLPVKISFTTDLPPDLWPIL